MRHVFLVCAIIGGTLLLCQFLLSLLGIGEHHGDAGGHDAHLDHGHDHGHGQGSAWLFGMLTFRSLVSGLRQRSLQRPASPSAGRDATGPLDASSGLQSEARDPGAGRDNASDEPGVGRDN